MVQIEVETSHSIEHRKPITPTNVFIDVDSTVSAIEGIDQLARWNGVYAEVSAMTSTAMNGDAKRPLREIHRQRLNLIRPTRWQLELLGEEYVAHITDEAQETIATLKSWGCRVSLLSGGYNPAIRKLGSFLKIPSYANELVFDAAGNYLGFDEENPLCHDHGKQQIINDIQQQFPGTALIVGDSLVDMLAIAQCKGKKTALCFTSVEERSNAVKYADHVITHFGQILDYV